MSFDSLLPHTCTIQLPGSEVVGEDDWGRPIYQPIKPYNTPCRYVTQQVKKRSSKGDATVTETSLLLPKSCQLDIDMKVTNVKDNDGNMIVAEINLLDRILPQTTAKKLHHCKVIVKGSV